MMLISYKLYDAYMMLSIGDVILKILSGHKYFFRVVEFHVFSRSAESRKYFRPSVIQKHYSTSCTVPRYDSVIASYGW